MLDQGMPLPVNEFKRSETKRLYGEGKGSRVIASTLKENPTTTYRRLVRMGLSRSKSEAQAVKVLPVLVPFSNQSSPQNLRRLAIGEAIKWFMSRGYTPSLPVETTKYDLVVESDVGLQRVQVKSTTRIRDGSWCVQTCRLQYNSSLVARGSAGKRRRSSYSKGEVDLFFIVTSDGSKYLIPSEVIGTNQQVTLSHRFDLYKI